MWLPRTGNCTSTGRGLCKSSSVAYRFHDVTVVTVSYTQNVLVEGSRFPFRAPASAVVVILVNWYLTTLAALRKMEPRSKLCVSFLGHGTNPGG